jgi:hypothetical protein
VDIYTSSAGYWKKITSAYVSSGGVWKRITSAYVSSGGVWKRFFSSSVSPGIASTVTISTAASSYSAALTGTNYHWNNSTSLTYNFQSSSDATTWANMTSSPTIANPASGSSNTVTFTPIKGNFSATPMYFRFVVTASNSTYSTSTTSTSASVSQTYPAPTAGSGVFGGSTVSGNSITYTPGATTNANSVANSLKRGSTLLGSSTGTTGIAYSLVTADEGYTLTGSTVATGQVSNATGTETSGTITAPPPPPPPPPDPTIANGSWSGTESTGNTVTYTRGAATNETSTKIYISRSDGTALVNGTNVASLAYAIVAADQGYQIQAYAVAKNATVTTFSAISSTGTIPTPVVGVAPSTPTGLYGSNNLYPVGGTFFWTASSTGTAPITYTFTLYKNGNFAATGSSTGTSYEVRDVGSFQLYLRATNDYGTSANTNATSTFT